MKAILIICWLLCLFSSIYAPGNDVEECTKKISSVFTFDSPLENFLNAFSSYTEDKFIGENALPEEAYGYYKDLLDMSHFEGLRNLQSPREFCKNVERHNNYHRIWSLPEYGIYQIADNENECIESLKEIGCYDNMSGIDTFKHLYFKGDDAEIYLEKIYPNWNTQHGNENEGDPEYEEFLLDIYNQRITWMYWYMNNLSHSYRLYSYVGTFRYPNDYCESIFSN